jgi:hypothetical protein
MATKKILVSDNSGSTEELLTINIGYNDITNAISASKITAYNLSSSLPSGILQANGNFISGSVITGSGGTSGSLLQLSGSRYVFNLPTNIGGDLSGSTTALNNVKVISVANVNSGTLAFANGGTGLSSALSGVLIKGAGDTLQVLTTLDTGSVIGLNADGWFIDTTDPTTNYRPRLNVYTSTTPNILWTKTGNPRFIEVLIIGSGGGGASGGTSNLYNAGGGGGGGGATLVKIEASQVSGAIINIGAGGSGGAARNSPSVNGLVGNAGTNSSFSCSLGNFYATAGGGGFSATPAAGGISGKGNKSFGAAAGGATNSLNVSGKPGGDDIYTSGGGSGGPINSSFHVGGNSGYVLEQNISCSGGLTASSPGAGDITVNKSIFLSDYYLNNSSTKTGVFSNPYFGCGGGGGASSNQVNNANGGNGGNGTFGGGGGGGGNKFGSPTLFASGRGGNGGDGVVFVYSY